MSHLNNAERRWLTDARRDAFGEVGASRADGRRLNGTIDDYLRSAGTVLAGFIQATAAAPPSSSGRPGVRRGSGPADPTGSQLAATLDTLAAVARGYSHLLTECPHTDEDHDRPRGCPPRGADTLDTIVGRYTDQPSDHSQLAVLLHTIPTTGLTGPDGRTIVTLADVVTAAARVHSRVARQLATVWHQADRTSSASTVDLVDTVDRAIQLTGRMRALQDRVAQWVPPLWRPCADGCGAAVPTLPPGSRERGGGAVCGRCRGRRHRAKQPNDRTA